ncbi:hypothetical protein [Alteribacillus iranensis]|uniref:hypothetical protein n=1 Tax=Alteribacillus iranensis TaxID=930128 RepID=UPI000B8A4E64|nr:hypothetical protein [Alteribacillus iranensis]
MVHIIYLEKTRPYFFEKGLHKSWAGDILLSVVKNTTTIELKKQLKKVLTPNGDGVIIKKSPLSDTEIVL